MSKTKFKTKPRKFTSWSNSRWNDYAQCPARANYKHNLKLQEPKSGYMDRGIEIAKMEEAFFKGDLKTLPVWPSKSKVESPGMVPDDPATWPKYTGKAADAKRDGLAIHPAIAPMLKSAKKQKDMFCEENWGFSKTWQVVDYFDWNNCWLRVKVDVGWGHLSKDNIVHLRDNKTGKFSEYEVEKYMEQLNLYAAAGAARFPHVEEFHVQLWFTDLGVAYPEQPKVITRKEALALQKRFTKQVQPMFNDERFDPTPNNKCRWCHFRADNGGPCKF